MIRQTWNEKDIEVIEKYKGMIYKLAFRCWRQLPASVKMWVEPEDLVAEAYLDILRSAKFRYRKAKAGKATFLWISISNLYLNFASKHRVQKRFGWRVPLEDIQWFGRQDVKIAEKESLDALARVYIEASEDCQERIKKWFGQEPVRAKRSERERQIYNEFCQLAKKNGLTKNDCRELMRGGVWIP